MPNWLESIVLLAGSVYLVFRVGKVVRTLADLRQVCDRQPTE